MDIPMTMPRQTMVVAEGVRWMHLRKVMEKITIFSFIFIATQCVHFILQEHVPHVTMCAPSGLLFWFLIWYVSLGYVFIFANDMYQAI